MNPYPYGTEEYYLWWEMQQQRKIPALPAAAAHDFNKYRECTRCGILEIDHELNPERTPCQ